MGDKDIIVYIKDISDDVDNNYYLFKNSMYYIWLKIYVNQENI